MMEREGGAHVLAIAVRAGDADGYSVVVEEDLPGTSLPIRGEGRLVLALEALRACATPRDYGLRLGEALFAGPTLAAWLRARARAPERLHVVLAVEAPELRSLRWERLCAPLDAGWDFLRCDQRTPFTLRAASESDREYAPPVDEPPRALLLVTSPTDLADYGLTGFDTLATVHGVRDALAPWPVDVLAFGLPDAVGPPTLEGLCAQLTARRYAVVHAVCHGAYAQGSGETVLYLADGDETTAATPASKLLRRLGRLGGEVGLPLLWFLGACAAAAPEAEGALGGLAVRLCRELGAPAVIAMSDRVSIDTASALAGPLYRQLRAHGLVDLALAEACSQVAERADVVVPVLHARAAGAPLLPVATSGHVLRDMPEGTAARIFSEAPLPLGLGDRFVDRSGPLEHLRRALVGVNPSAIALTAAGGLGKTRLALELVWRHGGRFPGGVFWLEVSAPARREAGLYALLRLLRPDTPALAQLQAQGVAIAAALAGAARAHARGGAQLWVLDHVPEAEGEQPGPGVAELCPRWGEVAVLVTSRMRPDEPALEVVELEALDEAAGAALLTAGLPPGSMRGEDAAAVVRWVGGLPVALELLARSLDLGDLSPDELLAQTRGEGVTRALGETQQALRRAGMASGLAPIVDSLRISYERLAPEAQALARCVAQLGPEPLPTALIKALGPVASRLARATLAARSFVTGISGEMFGAMHRVLADFLRGLCGPDEPAAACAALLAVMPAADCQNPARWPALTRLAPHAEALLGRAAPGAAGVVELGLRLGLVYHFQQRGFEGERVLRRTLELAAPLPATHRSRLTAAGNLAYALVTLGRLAEARALATATLALCEQALGPDDDLTLALRNNLALALQSLGELQAAHDELTRLAAQQGRVHGPDSAAVLNTWTSLAAAKQALGDLAGARALQERALAGWRRAGPDEPGGLLVAAGLAQTLQLQGDLAGAHARISAALAVGLRVWGPDHLSTLHLRETLAGVLRDQGDLAGARAQFEAVLAGQRRLVGPLHPRTLATQASLADVLAAQGELAAARSLQEEALALGRPHLGVHHPALLRTLVALSATLEAQGELPRCRELLAGGLDELRAALGPASLEALEVEQRLAEVLGLLGELDAARALQAGVLEALEARVGSRHAHALAAASALAQLDARRGALDGAEALQVRVLEDSRAALGRDHPETLLRARQLAATLLARGELARAEALQRETLAALQRRHAADDPGLLVAQVELAAVQEALGRLAEAEATLLPALSGLRARLPADHPALLEARAAEARLRLRQGRVEEGRALVTGLLAAVQARPGPASVPVAFMATTLGRTLFEAGDAAGAAPLFAAALAVFERTPDDANTVATALNLAVALARSGGERGDARGEAWAVLERARQRVLGAAGPDSPLLATIAEYAVKLGLAPA